MSSVLFCLWVMYIATTKAYFLSFDTVAFFNASRYCQTYCNSELAQIQSEAQYQRVVSQIENNGAYISSDIWIGSNLTSKYLADGEPVPSSSSSGDVHYYVVKTDGAPYQWASRMSSDRHHFLCHSCHGQINKYVGVTGVYDYADANEVCLAIFNTSVASITNNDDMFSARMTCREIDDNNGCWIGLKNFEWNDGTPFLYGAAFNQYPWFASRPQLQNSNVYEATIVSPISQAAAIPADSMDTCTLIKPSNAGDLGEYLWDNEVCSASASVLCNAPSEVCDSRHWFVVDTFDGQDSHTSDWTFNTGTRGMCGVRTPIDAFHHEHTLVLGGKQFYNANEAVLTVDMTYRIHEIGVSGSAGLVLFLDETRCDSFYYIGYWPVYSVLFMGTFIDGEWSFIDWRKTPFTTYQMGDDLALKVTLSADQVWNVYLNQSLLLENITHDAFGRHLQNSAWSGHIGIRSVNTSMSVQTLFVSGDAHFLNVYQQKLYQTCRNISYSSLSPTVMPTQRPTIRAASVPTNAPIKQRIVNEIQVYESPAPTPQPTDIYQHGNTNESVISAQYWHLSWLIGAPIFLIICCGVVMCAVHYYCCSGGEEYEYEPRHYGECDAYGPNSVDYRL